MKSFLVFEDLYNKSIRNIFLVSIVLTRTTKFLRQTKNKQKKKRNRERKKKLNSTTDVLLIKTVILRAFHMPKKMRTISPCEHVFTRTRAERMGAREKYVENTKKKK